MKIVSIIGARPQIIKAAALSRSIKNNFGSEIQEVIVHTGQHYDNNMSQVFIDELGIPQPDYNLNVGSGSHAVQTAAMITGIDHVLSREQPDYLVLYGDTNSTLAGAVAAAKMDIPIAHIEAGLRSFNRSMPEEINRILCDHVSTLLFSPTAAGYNNLIHEGYNKNNESPFAADKPGIFHCGDVMYDNSLYFKSLAKTHASILKTHNLQANGYYLCTIHRPANTDNEENLNGIFAALRHIVEKSGLSLVLPLHPRTKKLLEAKLDRSLFNTIHENSLFRIIEPVTFLEMIQLESECRMVFTDSGGVQKESYFFEKPCVILRPETEWTEIVEAGTALITDADQERIIRAWEYFNRSDLKLEFPSLFGDGKAADFICKTLLTG